MATAKKTRKASAPARKPAAKKKTTAAAPANAAKAVPAKPDKPKKAKLVRDSFTIPKAEYGVLQALKQRSGRSGTAAKKSEILRAGVMALAAMGDAAFAAAIGAVTPLKTGRPAKE
jgi:sRNA-binding protein